MFISYIMGLMYVDWMLWNTARNQCSRTWCKIISKGVVISLPQICLFYIDFTYSHSFSRIFHSLISSHPHTRKQWGVCPQVIWPGLLECNTESWGLCLVSPHYGFLIGGTELISGQTFLYPLGVVFCYSCCANRERNDICDMLQTHCYPPVASL